MPASPAAAPRARRCSCSSSLALKRRESVDDGCNPCTCIKSPKVHVALRRLHWPPNRLITPQVSGIRTNAAAEMLGISTSTLRTWERRYGFPRPVRSPGGHRHYALAEIEALRTTLAETHNVSSAVALARERG